MSKIKLVVLIIIAVIVAYVLFSYFFGSDKDKIKDIIFELQESIMRESMDGTFSDVSLQYQDESGIKYLPARFIMSKFFEHTDQINIRIPDIRITVQDDEATAEISVILTGYSSGKNHYILGEPDNPVLIDIGLEKGLTGWKIHSTKNIRPSKRYLRRSYSDDY